ncbi:hypothetical protein [Halovenus sp. HT40]|uniref:hypothetical protein n=1 Tax=Halovenus sp. HT40 TaxID=3126691 RepID=UPI00300EFC16
MTDTHTEGGTLLADIEPIVDHDSLRDREEIAFHEETDVVDAAVVDQIDELGDLAAAGITNSDGKLLFRRLTDTCSWKIPVATAAPDEDYAAELRDHVEETIGFSLRLDDIVGTWEFTVRTEDDEQTASRAFVAFSAAPVSDSYDLAAATPEDDPVEEAAWFSSPPEDADLIPGTDQFLD